MADGDGGLSAAVGAAAAGLGRLLLRVGRGDAAARTLAWAAGCGGRADAAAVEDALLAARAWIAAGALAAAEGLLSRVCARRPADARVLLELAEVLDRGERVAEADATLARLLDLEVAPTLRAEVLLRRAQLRGYAADPRGVPGDEAIGLLQAAFAADPRHPDAREALRCLAEVRGAWPVVVQTIAATLRGLPPGPESAALHLDLAELHLLHLGDPDSGRRSLGRALALAPNDALIRGRAVALIEAVLARAGAGDMSGGTDPAGPGDMPDGTGSVGPGDMSDGTGSAGPGDMSVKTDREPAWLRALAAAEELGDGARAAVWLVIGAVRLRGGALADAGAAWQRVFALGAPGEAALAEARQHLETLGAGGDLQAQRLALERLLAREDLPEERLSILARLQELGQALADDGLVEATCREALTLARGAQGVDELREGAAAALRAILARRGALAEILEVYAAVDADTRDPARAAVCLADAARFAEQLPGDLAVSLALRAWRRAPGGAAAAALIVELAEHAGHGPVLFAALEVEDLATAPRLALAVAAAALRHGEEAVGRRWPAAVARGADAAARREALARLDERLAASGPAGERLPVLRALVAELRAAVTGEGAVPEDRSSEAVPGDRSGEAVPGDRSGEAVPEDRSGGAVPGDRSNWDVPEDRSNGAVPEGRSNGAVPGDRSSEAVPEDRSGEAVPEDRSNVAVPEDRSALRRELGARTLELARLWLALGELDEALVTCTGAASGTGADAELLELAVGLLAQRERWAELAAVCERRAALAGAAGDGAGEAAWLTRAAQVGIDHATQPRRAMHEARRLLLRACRADARDEAARASLVPLSFAEHRWDEVLQVAEELRAIAGEDYDVLIVAAVTEAFVRGRALLARAVGGRHDTGTLRRLLAPALGRVLTEVARDGSLTQLDAVLAAATAMYGSATRLRVELQAWSAGRALQPGVTLGLARLHESIGHAATARALLQLAVFMAPQGPIAAWAAALPPAPPSAIPGHDPEPTLESREALRAVLRLMAGETAGIRALGEPPPGPKTAEEYQALALAEADVGPLRAALGLELPVLLGRGGPDGGVSVRNDRPPALVVSAALAGLPAAERRFRLALAAAMIASGLAIVTDPQGASLPELLAALHHLADETCPLRLPGAQTIVRACAARGFTRQRLPVGLREALAREISRWQHGRASVARLAHLLRRDNLRAATRLSGALDGALRTIGRDARLLPPGPLDEHGAAQVLASEDAQWLLRSSGVFA